MNFIQREGGIGQYLMRVNIFVLSIIFCLHILINRYSLDVINLKELTMFRDIILRMKELNVLWTFSFHPFINIKLNKITK